jgi:hypothetical protein
MRLLLLPLVCAVAQAVEPAATAIRLSVPPTIDGLLDDPVWLAVAADHRGVLAGWRTGEKATGETLAAQQRIAYVAWDATALYIACHAYTSDVGKIKVAGPFQGDGLEVWLHPAVDRHFQFALAADGVVSAGVVPTGTQASALTGAAAFTENGWACELAIPWTVLGLTPIPGLDLPFTLSANVAHQGDDRFSVLRWGTTYDGKDGNTRLRLVDSP